MQRGDHDVGVCSKALGRERIRHGDDSSAGRLRCDDPGGRVFDDDTLLQRHTELPARQQVTLRIGLAVDDQLARNDRLR